MIQTSMLIIGYSGRLVSVAYKNPGFLLVLQGPMENRFHIVCFLARGGRFNLILFDTTPNPLQSLRTSKKEGARWR